MREPVPPGAVVDDVNPSHADRSEATQQDQTVAARRDAGSFNAATRRSRPDGEDVISA